MDIQTSVAAVLFAFGVGMNAQPTPGVRSNEPAVFFSGSVAMEDGSKPPEAVVIQRVCKGIPQDETRTDSKGDFSFKVTAGGDTSSGDSGQAAPDKDMNRPWGNSTFYSNPITTSLRDCEVQAVLTGFWSERVSISLKNTLDSTRLGTLTLHPVTRAQSLTVSATTLAAPSNAKKAYDKGMLAVRDKRWDAALNELKKSVAAYPKFAVAWFELGLVQQVRNDPSAAVEAWKQALQSDPKFVLPYQGLVTLAERQQNWVDVEKYSSQWIQLDPDDFPAAYLYNAVSSARLDKVDQAEASARHGLTIDKDHKFPRLSYVLGLLLMPKHDYSAAAKCFRAYLEQAPNAKDAAIVREELSKIEAAAAAPQR
jgi:tetratricopeptide (TPR) repeat protein